MLWTKTNTFIFADCILAHCCYPQDTRMCVTCCRLQCSYNICISTWHIPYKYSSYAIGHVHVVYHSIVCIDKCSWYSSICKIAVHACTCSKCARIYLVSCLFWQLGVATCQHCVDCSYSNFTIVGRDPVTTVPTSSQYTTALFFFFAYTGTEVRCPFLDWTVLHSGWVWYSSLQDRGAGHTGIIVMLYKRSHLLWAFFSLMTSPSSIVKSWTMNPTSSKATSSALSCWKEGKQI